MPKSNHRLQGFTLMELMVTLVIVGILIAIAVPGYQSYLRRNHRTLAKTALIELAARQEQQFLRAHAYATSFSALNAQSGTSFYIDAKGAATASSSADSLYKIEFSGSPSASAFTLQATAVNSQARDTDCPTFQLSSTGMRTGSADCWDR